MFIRLEHTPKCFKTNFKKVKHSEIKTLITNHFFEKYTKKY